PSRRRRCSRARPRVRARPPRRRRGRLRPPAGRGRARARRRRRAPPPPPCDPGRSRRPPPEPRAMTTPAPSPPRSRSRPRSRGRPLHARPQPGYTPFGRGHTAARVLAGVIAAAGAAGARLPARTAHRLAVAGGTLEWAARPDKRRTLVENLAHAVGLEYSDPLWSIGRPGELLRQVRIEGRAGVDAALAEGRGVILAGPHIGGWEVVVP